MLSFIAERANEDAVALLRPSGQGMTYATLAMASSAVMQALGERVGDVHKRIVGVAVEDGAGFVASMLAVLEAGAVALPLDPRRGLEALEAEAAKLRALAVIVGDAAEDRLDIVAVDASRRELVADACVLLAAADGQRALHTRKSLGLGVDAVVAEAGLDAAARVALVGAPAATATLTGTILPTLRAGGTLLLLERLGPASQARAIGALRANIVSGPALEVAALAAEAAGLPATRVFVSGGRPKALERAFPAARIVRAFDSAEALRVATAEGDGAWTAVAGAECEFVDEGTALVMAPTMMVGYLDDAEATRAAFVGERVRARAVG